MRRLFFIAIFFVYSSAAAQNWVRVFSAPTIVTSAYFLNEFEGAIGTGRYESASPAQIYYTGDGGSSWTRAVMPNPAIGGQVTDIFFRDRFNGWASIKEYPEHGWSGLYHTSDGGRSWQLWYQADFIVGVRETSKGIFYSDRYRGVMRSTDGGSSFQKVSSQTGILGIDFLNDNIGIVTAEGNTASPLLITIDGGTNWNAVNTDREAWTPYADPASGILFFASERDYRQIPLASAIAASNDNGKTFSEKTYTANSLTGGIAGPRGCKTIVYAQGQGAPGEVDGLLRSTDAKNTWVNVGGPSNINDTRFAVTGRGAVVFAFDKGGGVWRTRNGGDGKLTSSVFPVLTISRIDLPDTISATVCDSADLTLRFSYSECDTLIVSRVDFLDDVDRELQHISVQSYFGKNGAVIDSLIIRYKPKQTRIITERLRFRFKNSDGSFEDSIMSFIFEGKAAQDKPHILEGGGAKTINFGSQNICAGDSAKTITVSNSGCAPMSVTSVVTTGSAFSLLSAFQPFMLDPGASRKFLIRFKPRVIGSFSGVVRVITGNASDSLSLTGIGIEGSRGVQLIQEQITPTICDSVDATFIIGNLSCSPVLLDSLSTSSPFTLLDDTRFVTIPKDSFVTFHVRFKSSVVGDYKREMQMYSTIAGSRFDTVLFINATATDGAANVTLSTAILDFGAVSTCGFKDMTLIITNSGCRKQTINNSSIDSNNINFLFRGNFPKVLAKGESDSIIIRFRPLTIGVHNSILHIGTGIGIKDIILTGIGTSDPGMLSLTASPIPQILTCSDTAFSLSLLNGSCDSLIFDSLKIGNTEYTVNANGFTSIDKATQISFTGIFTPSSTGDRSTTVHFYFHTSSGASKEISAPLNGSAIAPPAVIAAMPTATISEMIGKPVNIPIDMNGTTSKEVATAVLTFECNADVFTPLRFAPDASYTEATATLTAVTKTIFNISITFTPNMFLHSGALGRINGIVYLSDSLATEVRLRSIQLSDAASSSQCLPSALDNKPTRIELNTDCGEVLISKYMRGSLQFPLITSLKPNPTNGVVTVALHTSVRAESEIIVYDALGIMRSRHYISNDEIHKGKVELMIDGAAGLRFVELRTPLGTSISRVMLVK